MIAPGQLSLTVGSVQLSVSVSMSGQVFVTIHAYEQLSGSRWRGDQHRASRKKILRIDGDPEPYVRRVLVNTYASWWRRRWNGEKPTEVLPEVGHDPHEAHADRQDLWTALGRLPRRQRAAVVLRYYEDLSEAETAEVLGCSVGTVKSQTSRAVATLRAVMTEERRGT